MSDISEEQWDKELDDLLGGFLQTLANQLGDDMIDQCLTAVREANIKLLTGDHIDTDELNIVEKMLVTYCRATITFERGTLQ